MWEYHRIDVSEVIDANKTDSSFLKLILDFSYKYVMGAMI